MQITVSRKTSVSEDAPPINAASKQDPASATTQAVTSTGEETLTATDSKESEGVAASLSANVAHSSTEVLDDQRSWAATITFTRSHYSAFAQKYHGDDAMEPGKLYKMVRAAILTQPALAAVFERTTSIPIPVKTAKK